MQHLTLNYLYCLLERPDETTVSSHIIPYILQVITVFLLSLETILQW